MKPGASKEMKATTIGLNRVVLLWQPEEAGSRLLRRATGGVLPRHGLGVEETEGIVISDAPTSPFLDTVPVSLAEVAYEYTLHNSDGVVLACVFTSPEAWPEHLLPRLNLPGRSGWVAIYRKAWELTWRRIVTSHMLPSRFAYNDYPDNGVTYVWDSCFSTLFQRYAAPAGAHPCMSTLDDFYAAQTDSGYIPRNLRITDYVPQWGTERDRPSLTGTNPPLFAWAEWNYYLVSVDVDRLRRVLPRLICHYGFIEQFMQEKPGYYLWDGDGSGWDNINWGQGKDEIRHWVELPALQALAARHISRIAKALGETALARRFDAEVEQKGSRMKPYWNDAKSWYCSLTKDGRFTRKTLSGMWPLIAGIVSEKRAGRIVRETLMNPRCFLTDPTPLPALARDEPGYNSRGEYWLGATWINLTLMVIRGLEAYGFKAEAIELAEHTLDAIARVYAEWDEHPRTLWECYAPEFPAPASHKEHSPDRLGSVRPEFGGWTCCLINLLLENVLGIRVNAPGNVIVWDMRLAEEHGVEGLRFGDVTTDLHVDARAGPDATAAVTVRSARPYTLHITAAERSAQFHVREGESHYEV